MADEKYQPNAEEIAKKKENDYSMEQAAQTLLILRDKARPTPDSQYDPLIFRALLRVCLGVDIS